MATFKGDYLGFTYNGVHSSELGIFRVSEGGRFSESLLPNSQDKTVQRVGGDGAYFFGSQFTNKQITIPFAFDSLTENQLRRLRETFGDKKPHYLIFDEMPYKQYEAKVTGSSTIKFVPFSEGPTNRVYKGEGSVSFTCYQPYATSVEKFLDNYPQKGQEEWAESSGMLQSEDQVDRLNINDNAPHSGYIVLHNPGVKPSDWRMGINIREDGSLPSIQVILGDQTFTFSSCEKKGDDDYIIFNTKTRLIEGYCADSYDDDGAIIEYRKSGNIYNEHLDHGDFFDIPQGTSLRMNISTSDTSDRIIGLFRDIDYCYYYY